MSTPVKSDGAWTYQDVLAYFSTDLRAIEEAIFANLSQRNDLLRAITDYISRSGGKRLRPLLLCICARLNGYEGKDHVSLGNVVEYLHAATLLHDDVIDNASLRRGAPSANDRWGNHFAVLGGDYLYTSAFDILLGGFPRETIRVLCRSSMDMIEGEVLQRQWLGRLDISEETYFQIISLKTASLISASCRCGAMLGGVDPDRATDLAEFGRLLGIAFQVIDDTLDFTADPERLGKILGGDLRQGTVTLPLIYLMREKGFAAEKEGLLEAVQAGAVDEVRVRRVITLLKDYGCAERSMQKAARFAENAKEKLLPFTGSPLYPALTSAANFIIQRSH